MEAAMAQEAGVHGSTRRSTYECTGWSLSCHTGIYGREGQCSSRWRPPLAREPGATSAGTSIDHLRRHERQREQQRAHELVLMGCPIGAMAPPLGYYQTTRPQDSNHNSRTQKITNAYASIAFHSHVHSRMPLLLTAAPNVVGRRARHHTHSTPSTRMHTTDKRKTVGTRHDMPHGHTSWAGLCRRPASLGSRGCHTPPLLL